MNRECHNLGSETAKPAVVKIETVADKTIR